MFWDPLLVLQRHPPSSQPMTRHHVKNARKLYLHLIIAREPYDRSLATILKIPYEHVEGDRRLFGEFQSLHRQLIFILRGSLWNNASLRRHRELHAGIVMMMLIIFGIEPYHPFVSCGRDFEEGVKDTILQWEDGTFGDPNLREARRSVVGRLGELRTRYRKPMPDDDLVHWGRKRRKSEIPSRDDLLEMMDQSAKLDINHLIEELNYSHMLALANSYEGWAQGERTSIENSAKLLGAATGFRRLADEVGPSWSPPEPDHISLIGAVARWLVEPKSSP